jgi:hypothetical protein
MEKTKASEKSDMVTIRDEQKRKQNDREKQDEKERKKRDSDQDDTEDQPPRLDLKG